MNQNLSFKKDKSGKIVFLTKKDNKKTLSVNQTKCINCGICYAIGSKFFEEDKKNGTAIPKNLPENKSEEEDLSKNIIPFCPTEAIKYEE